jgi:hypothetical protein
MPVAFGLIKGRIGFRIDGGHLSDPLISLSAPPWLSGCGSVLGTQGFMKITLTNEEALAVATILMNVGGAGSYREATERAMDKLLVAFGYHLSGDFMDSSPYKTARSYLRTDYDGGMAWITPSPNRRNTERRGYDRRAG